MEVEFIIPLNTSTGLPVITPVVGLRNALYTKTSLLW